jgi:hypothetical protein
MVEVVDRRAVSVQHRNHLAAVVERHGRVAIQLNIDALEADIGVLPAKLRTVLTATQEWAASKSTDAGSLFDIYVSAEERKGSRARLASTPNGRARRLEWASDEHGLAEPLHYRWAQVSTLLDDLAHAE